MSWLFGGKSSMDLLDASQYLYMSTSALLYAYQPFFLALCFLFELACSQLRRRIRPVCRDPVYQDLILSGFKIAPPLTPRIA